MNSGCLDQTSSRSVSQCVREFPRVLHLSAVPAMELRCASKSPILRRAQPMNLRVSPHLLSSATPSNARAVARTAHLPVLPTVSLRVAPHSLSPGCRWRLAPRVSSHSSPSRGALAASANHSAGCPAARLTSCSYGWADVTPRLKSNLASPAWPRMNLC